MPVKLEWLGYRMVEKLWRCVKPFSYNTSVSRTDGRTELLYQYRASAAVCWQAIIKRCIPVQNIIMKGVSKLKSRSRDHSQAAVGSFIIRCSSRRGVAYLTKKKCLVSNFHLELCGCTSHSPDQFRPVTHLPSWRRGLWRFIAVWDGPRL